MKKTTSKLIHLLESYDVTDRHQQGKLITPLFFRPGLKLVKTIFVAGCKYSEKGTVPELLIRRLSHSLVCGS